MRTLGLCKCTDMYSVTVINQGNAKKHGHPRPPNCLQRWLFSDTRTKKEERCATRFHTIATARPLLRRNSSEGPPPLQLSPAGRRAATCHDFIAEHWENQPDLICTCHLGDTTGYFKRYTNGTSLQVTVYRHLPFSCPDRLPSSTDKKYPSYYYDKPMLLLLPLLPLPHHRPRNNRTRRTRNNKKKTKPAPTTAAKEVTCTAPFAATGIAQVCALPPPSTKSSGASRPHGLFSGI